MSERVYNVLFLCTGNSARSILAECLLAHWGKGRYRAFSAGSYPTGTVNPLAIKLLRKLRLPTDNLRSKSWDEFATPDAPLLDFVFTVCDQAAGEVCPLWPGQPVTAHWGVPDPAAVKGSDEERMKVFRDVARTLENRIKVFVSLPIAKLDRLVLTRAVREIGVAQNAAEFDMKDDLARRLAAEALGTAFLLATIVGSGIMGERLAGGNVAIALLANAMATAGMLYVLIEWFGPFSGAHFNPVVTLAMATRGDLPWRFVPAYVLVQSIGAISGVAIADLMFDLPAFSWSQHARTGIDQWLSEAVATFGLLGLIWVCSRQRPSVLSSLIAAYIGAAYWFTASTSFANPAVTIARAMTDTFAGIRPIDVPAFVMAQAVGAAASVAVFRWLMPTAVSLRRNAGEVEFQHPPGAAIT